MNRLHKILGIILGAKARADGLTPVMDLLEDEMRTAIAELMQQVTAVERPAEVQKPPDLVSHVAPASVIGQRVKSIETPEVKLVKDVGTGKKKKWTHEIWQASYAPVTAGKMLAMFAEGKPPSQVADVVGIKLTQAIDFRNARRQILKALPEDSELRQIYIANLVDVWESWEQRPRTARSN